MSDTGTKYIILEEGDVVQDGDEVDAASGWNDSPQWENVNCIGEIAPSPLYPAHRIYRRLIKSSNHT